MARSQNWLYYDTKYRKDREFSLCKWTLIRMDLMCVAMPHAHPGRFSRTFQGTTELAPAHNIPKGFCFSYHKRDQRCLDTTTCPWKHSCPRCHNKHPIYRTCQSNFQNSTNQRPSGKVLTSQPAARFPAASHPCELQYKELEILLKEYTDKNYIVFGFKIGFYLCFAGECPSLHAKNSPSVDLNPNIVRIKITEEMSVSRICGPFLSHPFP